MPTSQFNARKISFISKRIMKLFLKSESEVQFEGYKKGKATTLRVSPPLKMLTLFITKRSKFYLNQKSKTNHRRTQPTVGQAEVGS